MWCCVVKVDKVDKVGVRRELIQTNELYFFILFFSPVITVGSRFLHFVHFVHFSPEGRGEKKGTGSGIRARTVDAAEPSVNTRECSARPPMMQKNSPRSLRPPASSTPNSRCPEPVAFPEKNARRLASSVPIPIVAAVPRPYSDGDWSC